MAKIDGHAANLAVKIETNADFGLILKVKDTSGVLVDLTGFAGLMEIRHIKSNAVVITLSTANARIIMSNQGQISLRIPRLDMVNIKNMEAEYDLLITDPALITTRILEGNITFDDGVTIK